MNAIVFDKVWKEYGDHIVLEQIIDGVAKMKAATGRDQGAPKIVRALSQYGDYFNHAGWRPVATPKRGK